MKRFIDTADVNEIRAAWDMGCLDGVTTNPLLLAKVGRPLDETIREICSIVDGPISAESFAVLQQLAQHPLTDAGLARFLADSQKASGKEWS